MKNLNIYIYSLMILLLSSCGEDLKETNINPNESIAAQQDYLLSNAIKSSLDTYWGVENNMNTTLLLVQYWSKIQYTDPDRYLYTNTDFDNAWNNFYSRSLTDLNELIKLSDKSENGNYKAVALIIRSWIFSNLTDLYGKVPYSQAISIEQYLTPKYDSQEEVYKGILNDLNTAVKALDASANPISGDLIYNGNIDKWKKFGNSLKLRYALRIVDRLPEFSKQIISDLQSEPLIADLSETAQLKYLASPNQNPVGALFETRDDYRISKTIVETLRTLNDPRLPVYANRTETATPEVFVGVPNGLTNSDASNLGFSKTSKVGSYFTKAESPAVIVSYAEVLFNRAEAAARGLSNENPEELYKLAITASLQQFGISETAVSDYLAQPSVQYDPSNYKKSIGTQKWIALFGQGIEAFAEIRRLDYPLLTPAVAGGLNGKIPTRFIYPGSEQSLNRNSYTDAILTQGADLLTTKVWFDVN